MKSCLNCKHAEETIFDDSVKCICEESVYYGIIVDSRDLCRKFEEEENGHKFNINN